MFPEELAKALGFANGYVTAIEESVNWDGEFSRRVYKIRVYKRNE